MRLLTIIILMVCLTACSVREKKETRILFNGKDLTGWDTYIGPAFDTLLNRFDTLSARGLNNDPDHVFTVVVEDGQPAMRLSGNAFGGILTKEEFHNYHLSLQFKWGTKKYPNRLDKPRDSGVIYHSNGPHGAMQRSFMAGQEFQIQENDCGDYWAVGCMADAPAVGTEKDKYVFDPSASLVSLGGGAEAGNRCIRTPNRERPNGEWNTVELYIYGDSSIHMMNGTVNNMLFKSRHKVGDEIVSLKKGRIQFQVEGAELFYRNIEIESIKGIPPNLLSKVIE